MSEEREFLFDAVQIKKAEENLGAAREITDRIRRNVQ
jgi:hypothetical protein